MAVVEQVGGYPIIGGDLPARNNTGADIAVGIVVKISATGSSSTPMDITAATDDTGAIGITLEAIPNTKFGRVRCAGGAVGTADGSLTAGNIVMASSGGKVKAQAAGKRQLGWAMADATDGEAVPVWVTAANNA